MDPVSGKIVLALNSGSSTVKFGLYQLDGTHCETLLDDSISAGGRDASVDSIASVIADRALPEPSAIGHRVVHGGAACREHCRIDSAVLHQISSASSFAPAHAAATLVLIRDAQRRFPTLQHVACFDTTFHRTLPDVARVLPVDRSLQAEGIQRYGFHGLSCESIVRQLGSAIPPRVVIAHLGSGASVTALRNGQSVDTSMGLTPTGGVLMGTRSGDLDPGVLIHLLREKTLDLSGLEEMINHRSGLLGISGVSGDLRTLHQAAAHSTDARLAIQMFVVSVSKQIASMAVTLGGLDLLVFTGGIGENDPWVRAAICDSMKWTGLAIDYANNDRNSADPISTSASTIEVRMLSTQENLQIARHTFALTLQ